MEYSGRGDPVKSLMLLWRKPGVSPVGRTGLTVDSIVLAAIQIADESGLEELSMRALAKHLSVGTMSLYTHIPGKPELIDLMVDWVWGEVSEPIESESGWRSDLETLADRYFEMYVRHPWMAHLIGVRPVIGPSIMASWDTLLRPLEGIGLTDVEMDRVGTLINAFVSATARTYLSIVNIERLAGETLDDWWHRVAQPLSQVMNTSKWPVAERVGESVQAGDLYPDALMEGYRFQLGIILDGLEHLLQSREVTG